MEDGSPESHLYEVSHVTRYEYESTVSGCVMSLCMSPQSDRAQTIHRASLKIDPPTSCSAVVDEFGNTHELFDIHHRHDRLTISAEFTVERRRREHHQASLIEVGWDEIEVLRNSWLLWSLTHESALTQITPALADWLSRYTVDSGDDPYTRLKRLEMHIAENFEYVLGATHVDSTIDDLLRERAGVCQDFSHLMLAVVRTWGIAARYVSGYLFHRDDDDHRVGDASHCWIECLLPGRDWVAFDPTNPDADDASRIMLAIGRDYRDVSPTRGVTFGHVGNESEIYVDVQVRRVDAAIQMQSQSQARRLGP